MNEWDALINHAIAIRLLPAERQARAARLLSERLQDCGGFPVVSSLTQLIDAVTYYPHPQHVTREQKDAWEAELVDALMPTPSEAKAEFQRLVKESSREATDYLYRISTLSHYVKVDRNQTNPAWTYQGPPTIELTINVAKPEKDPRDIAAKAKQPSRGLLDCLLCKENEQNSVNGKANLRIVPLLLRGQVWHFQYSPYAYFLEHSIILSDDHRPMKIVPNTLYNLFDFVDQFPHYFVGSNADLPIVGGSLLDHDHYQAGRYQFPVESATSFYTRVLDDVTIDLLDWPLSTIKLTSANHSTLIRLFGQLLVAWQIYDNPGLDILSRTGTTPHSTITPILRRQDDHYVLYMMLRNNRTSTEHPDGIFHPHAEFHHLKKENIGLIEAMGLAILPGRLVQENTDILNYLNHQLPLPARSLKHHVWVDELKQSIQLPFSEADLHHAMGERFVALLSNCGVFKQDPVGEALFIDFVESVVLS